jgi:hypothetical protein
LRRKDLVFSWTKTGGGERIFLFQKHSIGDKIQPHPDQKYYFGHVVGLPAAPPSIKNFQNQKNCKTTSTFSKSGRSNPGF